MSDGIYRDRRGRYVAHVQIQDGVEKLGPFRSVRRARQEWAAGHLTLNNSRRAPSEARLFVERLMREWRWVEHTTRRRAS